MFWGKYIVQKLFKYVFLLLCSISILTFPHYKVLCAENILEFYNDPAGTQELNIYNIEKKREITSTGVISPDKTLMSYSAAYFYPANRQLTSKVFLVEKKFQIKTTDKIAKPILESGLDTLDKEIFRTLTIIDWSSDSKKLLIKEMEGEYLRGIWTTNLWIYNHETGKASKLNDLRKAIVHYWKNSQKIDLSDFRWDIVPLGWSADNPDMVLANAYGYGSSGKQFLGCWGFDVSSNKVKLLSVLKEKPLVAKNGFKFVPPKK